jgi:hypothetical protein
VVGSGADPGTPAADASGEAADTQGADAATEVRPRRGSDADAEADRRFLVAAILVGMAATAVACRLVDLLIHTGVYGELDDSLFVTPFWQDAVATLAGQLPYRDFALEYPPLSLPVFILPALPPFGSQLYLAYASAFELLMAVCAVGLVPIVGATIDRLGGGRAELVLGIGLVAISPLLLGSLSLSRYDLWPALLTAGATLAAVSGRHRIAFAVLALAVLAKVYPAVLIPIFIAWTWRTAGRREAAVATAIGAAVGLVGIVPFVILDAPGALEPFARALARPLQIESLGASLLAAAHEWLGTTMEPVTYGFGSFNLEGASASAAATIQTVILVVGLLLVWGAAARGRPDPGRFVLAGAAAIAIDVAFGKVLSPQYVIWLVPAVAVLASVAGARPLVGQAAVLVLTQLYYPGMYKHYVGPFESAAVLAVLERNVALVLVALGLAWATWGLAFLPARRPDPPADPALAGS